LKRLYLDSSDPAPVNDLEKLFYGNRKMGQKTLVIYLCAGYPDIDFGRELAMAVIDSGADAVELGMPFSDPLADGPVLQQASQQALAAGTNMKKVIDLVGEIKGQKNVPLLVMTYYNPLIRYGLDAFCCEAKMAGLDGIIVPDLSLEESADLVRYAKKYGLGYVPLAAPTSTPDRIRRIASIARGFIYCVSTTGTTGSTLRTFAEAENLAASFRKITSKPLALGFGIESPEHIYAAAPYCDGVIVGSALARLIEKYRSNRGLCLKKVSTYVESLKGACCGR